MRRCLLATLALLAAAPAAAAVAKAPSLAAIVLRPGEVGNGFRMVVIPGGNRVRGQVTLDLCGQTFPSEKLRVARLQVAYFDAAHNPRLSNEVVRYRPGGAAQAMRELQRVATRCSKGLSTGSMKWHVTRVTDPRLLQPYLAVILHGSGTTNGHHVDVTAFGVYHIRKNVLSGIYTAGEGTVQSQRRLALRAAAKSARKLKALVR